MAEGGVVREEMRAPPSWHSDKLSYDAWRFEVELWDAWTSVDKKKRGRLVMVALPIGDPNGAREKIRLAVQNGDVDLGSETGVAAILEELDKSFKKDNLSVVCEVWSDYINYKKGCETMSEYITEYEKRVSQLKREKITLPDVVLAMQLLNGCELEKKDRQIILTGVDYEKTDLFAQMKSSLRKFLGDSSPSKNIHQQDGDRAISVKEEPVNVTEGNYEEGYYTRYNRGGFQGGAYSRGRTGRGGSYRGGRGRGRGFSRDNASGGGSSGGGFSGGRGALRRKVNPRDSSGNLLRCNICDSIRHFQSECPDAWENMNKEAMPVREVKSEDAMKVSDYSLEDQQVLMCEAANAAVLDSACTKTVTGRAWKDTYIESLSPEERSQVKKLPGGTKFKFGGETRKESFEKLQIPVTIAGKKVTITTDVVESDIPLLLSKPDMKRFEMKLDLENDTANIFGKKIVLDTTSSGHYCLPLRECEVRLEEIHLALNEKLPQEKEKMVQKLHRQFAHPSARNLKALMKNAEVLDPEIEEKIEKISETCNVCKRYKKTPARPVVCMPLATRFNETVAMDLKEYKPGFFFLHVIDLHTRFGLARVIKRKLPNVIVDNVILMWIASGLGAPEKFLIDNGGEFCNSIYKEMAEQFNVEICSTGAESPWSNGICERNHAVVDAAVYRMMEEDASLDLETALAWAVNAKNAMLNHNGFSPYQLIFGQNPNLPSVMTNKLPALESHTTSEKVAKHLNALHAARRAYIKAEASDRVKRALRHQVRAVEEVFNPGDKVYYKRDNSHRWRGPGKVLGQDNKIVFVRHGDQLVRVSTCRLVRVGQEFSQSAAHVADKSEASEEKRLGEKDKSPRTEDTRCLHGPYSNLDAPQLHNNPRDSQNDETDVVQIDNTDQVEANEGGQHEEEHRMNQDRTTRHPGNAEHTRTTSQTGPSMVPEKGDRIRFRSDEEEWTDAIVLGKGGKATGKNKYWYNVLSDKNQKMGVDLTQVDFELLSDKDETNFTTVPTEENWKSEVKDAKEKELENWIKFDVYKEVEDKGQQTLSTKWVVTEKEFPDNKKGTKARLVVRGFEEEGHNQVDSPTAAKATLRVFLAVATNEHWKCETIDIKAAFLQGKEIEREVYLRPPAEARVDGYIWKLNKVVYGLDDAARNWFFTVVDDLKKLGCQQSMLDKAMLRWYKDRKLQGMFLMHVDDFLIAGTNHFMKEVIGPLLEKYKVGKRQDGSFRYVGIDIDQTQGGLVIQQKKYIEEIKIMPISTTRKTDRQAFLNSEETRDFRGVIGQLNWISGQTRPDATFDMLALSTANKHPTVQNVIDANKAVIKVKSREVGVRYHHLGSFEELGLQVFTDAAWANLPDGSSSTGGYVIFLTGKDKKSVPLDWSASKIKRTVHSTLAAEALAMLDSVDNAVYIGSMITELYRGQFKKNEIPVTVYTDSKSVHENLHSTKQVNEKRLRVTMAELQEMLQKKEIQTIRWIPSKLLIADALTKKGVSCDKLLDCFTFGHLETV